MKYGVRIHWGLYSVPAFGNEWYPRLMYVEGSPENKHHIATYGSLDKFGYKEFISMFKAEHFNAAAWAELFKKAGAKYVVPVAEHHDGEVVLAREAELDVGADPFGRAVLHAPAHLVAGRELEHVHVVHAGGARLFRLRLRL